MRAIPDLVPDITGLLHAWRGGNEQAFEMLVPLVHEELRRVARGCLKGDRGNRSVQPTALVNEAFLRLVDAQRVDWQNRVHFLSIAARLMRRVLIDFARARRAHKRGGVDLRVTLDEASISDERGASLLRLEDALETLAALDARKSRVVELKFFGGLSADEIAAVLGVSSKTILRDWEFARAWLRHEMSGERHDDA